MKLGDTFKKLLSLDNDDLYEEEEEIDVPQTEDEPRPAPRFPKAETRPARNQQPATRVVDIHTTAKLQVVLKKPEHFDEATAIADELLEKRTVVLNLEATAKEHAGKLLCFLSGVAYANGGKLKKISNNTYIITPYNVDVMGDLLDELENNGMFFV